MRRLGVILATSVALISAAPADAIVGGQDASPGEYPSVAEISYGLFGCTGTLIAPTKVLTAGHCSSITGAAVATPASWPAPLIDVRIGGTTAGSGERVPVSSVSMHPSYLLGQGYDISILTLSRASTKTPTKVAGSGETALWAAGTTATIAGWGVTSEGGSAPSVLQEAQVPVTTDAYCANAYSSFDVETMLCAGYPQGGVDSCQGDSGGPLFSGDRVIGATSFGEGCARAGKPGVYARVADALLREWIRSKAPAGVA